MILSYTDIFEDGKPCRIKADITTDHPASSYGMPVVVLPDGQALSADSWVLLNYHVVKASKAEATLMERWLKNLYAMMGIQQSPAAALGSIRSEKKAAASRENGKKGGAKTILRKACEDSRGQFDVRPGTDIAHRLIGATESTIARYVRKGWLKKVGSGLVLTKAGYDAA